jgi:hypothetical protein
VVVTAANWEDVREELAVAVAVATVAAVGAEAAVGVVVVAVAEGVARLVWAR